jgi:hypothetical protein
LKKEEQEIYYTQYQYDGYSSNSHNPPLFIL